MAAVQRQAGSVGDAVLSMLRCGNGEPVVLLHGIPTGAELWRATLGILGAAGLHALAPDLPGYGGTRLPPDGDHSLAGSAALIARWMSQSSLAPAWVVGHDAGGGVAQILAVAHPTVVSRLTLVNSIADGSWPAPRARFARAAARAGLYRPAAAARVVPNPYLRREVLRAFADRGRGRRALAEAGARVLWDGKFSDAAGRAGFQRHLAALDPRDTARITAGLATLAMPCQLVWGVADPFQRWAGPGQRLETLLPQPEVSLLDGCGHFPPLECPERLCGALLSWQPTGTRGGAPPATMGAEEIRNGNIRRPP